MAGRSGESERIRGNREQLIEEIYQRAVAQNLHFKDTHLAEEVKQVIASCLEETEVLEAAGTPQNALRDLTREVAENITAIWVLSGSGTYESATGNDTYRNISWMQWSDRNRINYSAWLVRKISEVLNPFISTKTPKGDVSETIGAKRESIEVYGPSLIYNATDEMNQVMRDALAANQTIMPEEKMRILGRKILKTIDQITTFVLPDHLHVPGKEIAIVSHAPHLVRFAHILNQRKCLPPDMRVRFFPIASPKEAKGEYVKMEILGMLYALYEAKTATKEPYPYIIHGKD